MNYYIYVFIYMNMTIGFSKCHKPEQYPCDDSPLKLLRLSPLWWEGVWLEKTEEKRKKKKNREKNEGKGKKN